MSLLPFMSSITDSKIYEPDLAPWEGILQLKKDVIKQIPWDVASIKTFELVKRLTKESSLDSFMSLVTLLEQRFVQMKLPREKVELIEQLLKLLKQTTQSTVRHIVENLLEMVDAVKNGGVGVFEGEKF